MNNKCEHISKKRKINEPNTGRPELELAIQRYQYYDKFPYDEHIDLCEQYGINPYQPKSVYITNLTWLENDMSLPILHTYGLRPRRLKNLNHIMKKQEEIHAKYPWVAIEACNIPSPIDTINYEKYIRECLNTLTDDELKMLVPNEIE
jgi:hypothetical protein